MNRIECAYDVLADWYARLGKLTWSDIVFQYSRMHQEARFTLRMVGWSHMYLPNRNQLLAAMDRVATPAPKKQLWLLLDDGMFEPPNAPRT